METSRDETIQFILKYSQSLKKEELDKLSLVSLVIIKTQIEIEINNKNKK